MKKRLVVAVCAAVSMLPLAACAGGYGYGGGAGVYAGGPYAYDGFYDDYYGPVYDGYWGDDGAFYYRHNGNDRRFVRGDPAHFNRSASPGGRFHPMQGSMTPGAGMRMPHFAGGGGGHGSGHH